jgi:ubiquinone/menaquinone biosynthesis C-methylase UbiE
MASKLFYKENKVFAIDSEDLSKEFEGIPIKFIRYNLDKPLPFNDQYFDYIFGIEILEHLPHLEFTLREIKRILKMDGTFVVEVPNVRWNRFCDFLKYLHTPFSYFYNLYTKTKTAVCNIEKKNIPIKSLFINNLLKKRFDIVSTYIYLANYSSRSHLHKHNYKWWKKKFEDTGFKVKDMRGIHLFNLLSFWPISLQKKIYLMEQRLGRKWFILNFSSLLFFVLTKGKNESTTYRSSWSL